jgi:predicted adenine nucleotide alpha hydrolase (AANH) superfamily ATPase
MNPDRDQVIEKIKKLLRMKRGGTPGEIETALAMAAELARKHGIDLADVNPDEESERTRIGHVEEVLGLRMPIEAKFAAAICVNFFNVEILWKQGLCRWWVKMPNKLVFVGTAWDTEVARYVFVFLQGHFRRSWNHRKNRRLRNREAFLHGMYCGLRKKLHDQREAQIEAGPADPTALVRIERAAALRKDYLKKLCPDNQDSPLPNEDSAAWSSKVAGYLEGEKTEIRSGLNRPTDRARLALPPAVGQLELI